MGFGSFLGSISPAFGIASGHGAFGHLFGGRGGANGAGGGTMTPGGGMGGGPIPGQAAPGMAPPPPAPAQPPMAQPPAPMGGDGDGPDKEGRRDAVMDGAQPLGHMGGPDLASAMAGLPQQIKTPQGGFHMNPQQVQGILASLRMMAPGGGRF